jgi:hypothetical protein
MVVTAAKGYDLGYIWKTQAEPGPSRTTGGYYINAAQDGEPPAVGGDQAHKPSASPRARWLSSRHTNARRLAAFGDLQEHKTSAPNINRHAREWCCHKRSIHTERRISYEGSDQRLSPRVSVLAYTTPVMRALPKRKNPRFNQAGV